MYNYVHSVQKCVESKQETADRGKGEKTKTFPVLPFALFPSLTQASGVIDLLRNKKWKI
jgi:hypothetical protein